MPTTNSRTSSLSVLAVSTLLLAAGCARQGRPAAAASPPPARSPRQVASAAGPNAVQRTPEYAEAARLYRKGDRAGASAALGRIKPGADWTAEEREYLERQKGIVEGRRADGPSKVERRRSNGERRTAAEADCGPRALLIVCERLGVRAELAELRRLAGTTGVGTTLEGLAKAAKAKGLRAEGVQMNQTALASLSSPAIAWVSGDHYVAVLGGRGGEAEVRDPNAAASERWTLEELVRRSGGVVLRVEGRRSKVER